MWQLNLPQYNFRIKKQNEKYLIFDSFRKKFVALTPEEWVRQHFLQYISMEKKYPTSLIGVEKQVKVNNLSKRYDAILFDFNGNPSLIFEFKAPNVEITQGVFDQVAIYNSKLKVDYFIISNGLKHYFCKVNCQNLRYEFLIDIPDFVELSNLLSK